MSISSVKTGAVGVSLLAGNTFYDPAATFLITRQTLSTTASSVTFSSIPSTYKHLQIRSLSRNENASIGNANLLVRFNSDSGANYTRHYLRGNGSAATTTGSSSQTSVIVQDGDLAYNTSSLFRAVSIIDIHDYASTTKYKTVRSFAGQDVNSGTAGVAVALSSALWLDTTAITSITITSSTGSNLSAGSTFALYGMVG